MEVFYCATLAQIAVSPQPFKIPNKILITKLKNFQRRKYGTSIQTYLMSGKQHGSCSQTELEISGRWFTHYVFTGDEVQQVVNQLLKTHNAHRNVPTLYSHHLFNGRQLKRCNFSLTASIIFYNISLSVLFSQPIFPQSP